MFRRHSCSRGVATISMVGLTVSSLVSAAHAQSVNPSPTSDLSPKWAIGIEYLSPTKKDRPIDTTNLNLLYNWKKPNVTLKKANLLLMLGVTATHATGTITQLTGSYEEGTLKPVTLVSNGNGIGPVFLLRYNALHSGRTTFCLDGSHGIIFYDRSFPAGGDRYNGMRRIGPSFTYRASDRYSLNIGYRWMHVSNGKGLIPHNPAYEARGANLQLQLSY